MTAHPLAALRVPLASVAGHGSAAPGPLADRPWLGPQAGPLLTAWCQVWGDLVGRAAVEAALPAGLRLAALNRVESWQRCLATASAAERAAYGEAVPRWLVRVVG